MLNPPIALSPESDINATSVAPTLAPGSGSSAERPALVIGDLHGHLDRFEALLKQEGLLDRCEACDGGGQVWEPCDHYECEYERKCPDMIECLNCHGDGWARTDKDADVILLGDVGHFGTQGSPTGDEMTWRAALHWADVILWGNHDRAMVDNTHAFSDFYRHPVSCVHMMRSAMAEGKLKLAHVSHNFLLTHAGLHLAFRDQQVHPDIKRDMRVFADWINKVNDPDAEGTLNQIGIRDAISRTRGGGSNAGGILWRDIDEKLHHWRQVFGHSADHGKHQVKFVWEGGHSRYANAIPHWAWENGRFSYCIDIGGKGDKPGDNCLAGIWLPEERIVRVDL